MKHRRAISPLLATIILIAITIMGGAAVYVVFSNRSGVAGDVHSIQVENAQLFDPTTVNVTVDSAPSGLSDALVVDGVTYTGPVTFTWQVDTQHSIDALSPIGGYTFVSWRDGNGQSHTIWTNNGDANYTATYGNANVTLDTSPSGEWVLIVDNVQYTSPVTFNWIIGDTHHITAEGFTGYAFDRWSDNNTDDPRNFTVTGDITLTAVYAQAILVEISSYSYDARLGTGEDQTQFTIDNNQPLLVDGVRTNYGSYFYWKVGSTHTLQALTWYGFGYDFSYWSGIPTYYSSMNTSSPSITYTVAANDTLWTYYNIPAVRFWADYSADWNYIVSTSGPNFTIDGVAQLNGGLIWLDGGNHTFTFPTTYDSNGWTYSFIGNNTFSNGDLSSPNNTWGGWPTSVERIYGALYAEFSNIFVGGPVQITTSYITNVTVSGDVTTVFVDVPDDLWIGTTSFAYNPVVMPLTVYTSYVNWGGDFNATNSVSVNGVRRSTTITTGINLDGVSDPQVSLVANKTLVLGNTTLYFWNWYGNDYTGDIQNVTYVLHAESIYSLGYNTEVYAFYATAPLVKVFVNVDPTYITDNRTGSAVSVDGYSGYGVGGPYYWYAGSTHNVTAIPIGYNVTATHCYIGDSRVPGTFNLASIRPDAMVCIPTYNVTEALQFSSWSDGGAISHTLVVPWVDNINYTAFYANSTTPPPSSSKHWILVLTLKDTGSVPIVGVSLSFNGSILPAIWMPNPATTSIRPGSSFSTVYAFDSSGIYAGGTYVFSVATTYADGSTFTYFIQVVAT